MPIQPPSAIELYALKKLLGKDVIFLGDSIGDQTKEICSNLKKGQIALLENLRFYKEETKAI